VTPAASSESFSPRTVRQRPRESRTTAWIEQTAGAADPALRLFCFPYAGGSSLIFLKWPRLLPATVDVCPVQLPGRGRRIREEPFRRLGPLVDALMEALLPYFDLPFAFFGHSMGALISYELARRLRERDRRGPAAIFVSGRRPPHLPLSEPTHHLPDVEFIEDLRRLNGTPEEVLASPEATELLLPMLRADFAVCQTYEYRERSPITCPIVSFGGLQDTDAVREELREWRRHTTGQFHLHLLPGDHFFINSQQPQLLRLLSKHLLAMLQER
jgi:medium-chain acyl-[acyl-carrier-protein] hydrolase